MGSLLEKFRSRTLAGTRALVASLQVAVKEPERAAYLVTAGLGAGAAALGQPRMAALARLSLPPLLAGGVLRSRVNRSGKNLLLAGLGAGLIGEAAKLRNPDQPSAVGIAGVTGQYLGYVVLLSGQGARPATGDLVARGAILTAATALATRGGARLSWATGIAGLSVVAVSALAQDRVLQDGSLSRQGVDHAANLLLISEGFSLIRVVLPWEKWQLAGLVEAAQISTGGIGDLLLVDGLSRS